MAYRDMSVQALRSLQRKLFEGDSLGVLSDAHEAYQAIERELKRRKKAKKET
jgi:hypothetical protein